MTVKSIMKQCENLSLKQLEQFKEELMGLIVQKRIAPSSELKTLLGCELEELDDRIFMDKKLAYKQVKGSFKSYMYSPTRLSVCLDLEGFTYKQHIIEPSRVVMLLVVDIDGYIHPIKVSKSAVSKGVDYKGNKVVLSHIEPRMIPIALEHKGEALCLSHDMFGYNSVHNGTFFVNPDHQVRGYNFVIPKAYNFGIPSVKSIEECEIGLTSLKQDLIYIRKKRIRQLVQVLLKTVEKELERIRIYSYPECKTTWNLALSAFMYPSLYYAIDMMDTQLAGKRWEVLQHSQKYDDPCYAKVYTYNYFDFSRKPKYFPNLT